MTVPSVDLNELDNQVGVALPDGDVLCVVGVNGNASGTNNVPVTVTRKADAQTLFGTTQSNGILAEFVCWFIDTYGVAVVVCPTAQTTAGGYGAVTFTGTGSSVVTAHAATHPWDDYDVLVKVTLGGTIAAGPITYIYSLDGGLTFSAPISLGVLNTITITEGNAQFDLGAGTLVTGDTFSCRTTAPIWNGSQLTAALEGVRTSQIKTDLILVLGQCAAADGTTIDTEAGVFSNFAKERAFLAAARGYNLAESDSTYQTSLATAWASFVSKYTDVGAGDCEIQSPISSHRYRRPAQWAHAGRIANISPGVDPAYKGLGPLPASVRITDDNGNPKWHDELVFPGLDDQRFSTLRTWNGSRGVYVNNARMMSATGSDFVYIQHRRVMNHVRQIVRPVLENVSSQDLLVDPTTGWILDEEAASIDELVNAALQTNILDKRMASSAKFRLSRTDNLLSTFTLNGSTRVIPLAYPKKIKVDVGFYNPAMHFVAQPNA